MNWNDVFKLWHLGGNAKAPKCDLSSSEGCVETFSQSEQYAKWLILSGLFTSHLKSILCTHFIVNERKRKAIQQSMNHIWLRYFGHSTNVSCKIRTWVTVATAVASPQIDYKIQRCCQFFIYLYIYIIYVQKH